MLATTITTARDTFNYASDKIAGGLVPQGRATAVAATFKQLAEIAGDHPLTPGDLVAGQQLLVSPQAEDELTSISARRKTCSDIAWLLRPVAHGDARKLAVVFRVVASHFSGSNDPRQAAIGATAEREAAEIEARS